ncbi:MULTISPECIES: hypothetical protein [Bradyrhizobium]|jgi:hypothetical protein|uniref:Uncharacterized protein n=1 Tax=Bradyrhizobium elkanii TaxID=29448 RepID=A0A8I1Y8F0_BRAEL|nr:MULTISPECIES: hypothetical protein [Bradyrhizobium]MBP1295180.1 hypothetical protein [Bradyrhizobium elkanii]MCP1933920.1 hypothetical protein [Bradyrhizobium elkanii]MCS3478072.1 hypothetical protein [Bradyrhizobium elkanii]MCS3584845.1 hypothetical protein [Bradyrhizobium elkanii]MCS3718420.1 hypothetical protein [Bradyrhizobium elkanii]
MPRPTPKDRRDQNPVFQAYGVSNAITIAHWTGLPLNGRTGKANALILLPYGGAALRGSRIALRLLEKLSFGGCLPGPTIAL